MWADHASCSWRWYSGDVRAESCIGHRWSVSDCETNYCEANVVKFEQIHTFDVSVVSLTARPTAAMFLVLALVVMQRDLKFESLICGWARSHHGDGKNLQQIVNLSESSTCVKDDLGRVVVSLGLIYP